MKEKDWIPTKTQHLIRHSPSGTFYLQKWIGGRSVRASLQTDSISVAKAKLPIEIKKLVAQNNYISSKGSNASSSLFECFEVVKARESSKPKLRPNSVKYRKECFEVLEKTFPALFKLKPKEITPSLCASWFLSIKPPIKSPGYANNTLGSLRMVMKEAIKCGLIMNDPTNHLEKFPIKQKRLTLPSPEKFREFVAAIRKPKNEKKHSWRSDACADLVEFIAYSGCRLDGAINVKWSDIDERGETIHVTEKGDKDRYIPMISAMTELLKRLPKKGDLVLRVKEAEQSMTRAAKEIGMERITHHDLRHLFATTCIESGVDIPTVSSWLGHVDGGALLLKTYRHLRANHSASAAAKVSFA